MKFKIIKTAMDINIVFQTSLTEKMLKTVPAEAKTLFNEKGEAVFKVEFGENPSLSDKGVIVNGTSCTFSHGMSDSETLELTKMKLGVIKPMYEKVEAQVEEAYKKLVDAAKTIDVEEVA